VTFITTDILRCVECNLPADSSYGMMIRSLRLREFLIDDGGAEIVEFAIILASFTIITMSALSYLGSQASAQVSTQSGSLTNGALNPP
jgi:Flp pilus assembly pilin Flp